MERVRYFGAADSPDMRESGFRFCSLVGPGRAGAGDEVCDGGRPVNGGDFLGVKAKG